MYVCTACGVVQLLCYRYPSAASCMQWQWQLAGARCHVASGKWWWQVARVATVASEVPSGLANVAPIWGCNAKGKYAFIHLVSLCVCEQGNLSLCVCVCAWFIPFVRVRPRGKLCACVSLKSQTPKKQTPETRNYVLSGLCVRSCVCVCVRVLCVGSFSYQTFGILSLEFKNFVAKFCGIHRQKLS